MVESRNCLTFSELRCLQEMHQLLGYIHKLTINLESDNASPWMVRGVIERRKI